MTVTVAPPNLTTALRVCTVLVALTAAAGAVEAQVREVELDLARGELRDRLELELRVRGLTPVGVGASENEVAAIRADDAGVAVRTMLGESRVTTPVDDPGAAAIAIACQVDDALVAIGRLGDGTLGSVAPAPSTRLFGDAEAGVLFVVDPSDVSAYGRAQLGVQWAQGPHVAFALDALGYHWSSASSSQTGVGLHLGLDAGIRVRVDDFALEFSIDALVGTPARPIHPAASNQLAAMLGGSLGAGLSIVHWLELGIRVRGDAMVYERDGVFALFRVGLHAEFR